MRPWRKRDTGYQAQEKREGKKSGARPQLNSGRTWSGKLDTRRSLGRVLDGLLADSKQRPGGSFTIREDEWNQMKRDAARTGHNVILTLEIGDLELTVLETKLWDQVVEVIQKEPDV